MFSPENSANDCAQRAAACLFKRPPLASGSRAAIDTQADTRAWPRTATGGPLVALAPAKITSPLWAALPEQSAGDSFHLGVKSRLLTHSLAPGGLSRSANWHSAQVSRAELEPTDRRSFMLFI